jgi:hypothetical protein
VGWDNQSLKRKARKMYISLIQSGCTSRNRTC